jgi:HAE1 family hydrophobic/amphiphilic exporter-1
MRLSTLSIRKPIATTMVFTALSLLGIVAFLRTGVDLLPNIAIPRLVVSTTLRDATPEEVETLITEPLEAAASTIQGIKRVQSVSREGISVIMLDFTWGTAMDVTLLALREKLDNARFLLPREAGRPTITRLDPASQPIMTLALSYNDTSRASASRKATSTLRFVHQNSDAADIERLIALKEAGRLVFKRRLEQMQGVAQAALTGGLEREIIVEFNPEQLAKYGITLDEAASALKASNLSIPAGSILRGLFKYSLRALGEFATLKDIENTVIRRASDQGIILLSDIARVRSTCKERLGLTRFDGAEAVGVHLYKDPAANTVDIATRVRAICDTLNKEYPGFRIAVIADNSSFIEAAISNVQQEIFYGGILAVLVLFLFLRSTRNIVIIGITIPVALVITALLMYLFGVQFNIISLGGIAVGVGLLLDGSIVVIECIARKREEGLPPRKAALDGIREVGMPIAAGTITTMAVFLPLVFLRGIAGELFKDQSYTVVFSLAASLVVALTLIPMLAARERTTSHKQSRRVFAVFTPVFDGLERAVSSTMRFYDRALLWALDHPVRTLVTTALLLVLAIVVVVIMPKEFMPEAEQEEFILALEFPAGTSLAGSAVRTEAVESALLAIPGVEHCVADIGIVNELALAAETRSVSAPVNILVKLRSLEDNARVQASIRQLLTSLPEFADIRFSLRLRESAFSHIIRPSERDIVIRVQSRDLNHAFAEAQALADELSSTIGGGFSELRGATQDVRTGLGISPSSALSFVALATDKAEPEYRIVIDREQCLRYGIQAGDAARSIAEITRGKVATTFPEFDKKIDIRIKPLITNPVSAAPSVVITTEPSIGIEELFRQYVQLPSRGGASASERGSGGNGSTFNGVFASDSQRSGLISLPVSAIARWERTQTFREVRREDGLRTVYLYADVREGSDVETAVQQVQRVVARRPQLPQARTTVGGTNEEIQEAFGVLYAALGISALLMYTVLAVEFESLLFPLVIMLSLPLGLIGAVLTLFLAGASLNVVSLMGLVILIGIADNDAVVKVETILAKRKAGLPLREAIIAAGQERFRPIVMNSLTVIFGLIPMMLGSGAATQLRTSLSLAVIGGLLSATALTLVVIPVLYVFAERMQTIVRPTGKADDTGTDSLLVLPSEPNAAAQVPPQGQAFS